MKQPKPYNPSGSERVVERAAAFRGAEAYVSSLSDEEYADARVKWLAATPASLWERYAKMQHSDSRVIWAIWSLKHE